MASIRSVLHLLKHILTLPLLIGAIFLFMIVVAFAPASSRQEEG